MRPARRTTALAARGGVAAALAVLLAACGAPGQPGSAPEEDGATGGEAETSDEPFQVGLVYSQTGPLATAP